MNKIFFVVLIFAICILPMADEIYLSRDKANTNIRFVEDNLKTRANANVVVECHIQSMTTDEVKTEQGTFNQLYVKGWQNTNKAGHPELPVLSRIIEVPFGGKISARVVSSSMVESDAKMYGINHAIFPHQPSRRRDQKEVPFAYSRAAYQESFSRAPIVSVQELGYMRARRLALVSFTPVEYDAAKGIIRIHNDIKAEITIENADLEGTMKMKSKLASPYFNYFSARVMTPASLSYTAQNRNIGYLIVADKMFEGNTELAKFVAFKEKMGYDVTIKFFSNATVEGVQDYIRQQFNSNAPTFLLIAADQQIPAKNCGRHYSDLYYHSTLVGGSSDYIPDMLCGRFSANNAAELEAQIEKTMAYEQKQFMDVNYLNQYALVAGWDGSWAIKRGYPQIRYAVEYYFNEKNGYTAPIGDAVADRNVFLSAGSHQNESAIIALVSKGVGFFNYTAHGSQTEFCDPEFTFSDIDNLKNTNKYPLVIGNCCLTGSLQKTTCFGEKWLRAEKKGAIGFIGGSNYTYWDEDLWFGVGNCSLTSSINSGNFPKKADTGVGLYEAGFGEFDSTIPEEFQIKCNATVMYAGNMAVMASSSTRKEYYWQVYHLFGDPSLPTYWAHK